MYVVYVYCTNRECAGYLTSIDYDLTFVYLDLYFFNRSLEFGIPNS